ncbi:hypothetical protein B0O99DRAFT_693627 [Bisporella sp. PMI_857]|nr:hypothetical protein B0O99DRAFT_693627 [Bisporella sp. PMI_857]
MQFSAVLPIAFYLITAIWANPLVLHEKHMAGGRQGAGAAAGAGNATGRVCAEVKANVTAQISKWLGDIESVNKFVDTVGSVTDLEVISSMAATAFVAAQDEGASNTILQQDVTLDASGQAAAKALLGQFNIIGPAINDTIFNPGNVKKNLNAINGARCPPPQGAGAISQEGAVQAAAALAVGITIPPPQTPAACAAVAAATC